jgi:hypothetical protein
MKTIKQIVPIDEEIINAFGNEHSNRIADEIDTIHLVLVLINNVG